MLGLQFLLVLKAISEAWSSHLLQLQPHHFVFILQLFHFIHLGGNNFQLSVFFFQLQQLLMDVICTTLPLQIEYFL